jgi:WD40 repeat protein
MMSNEEPSARQYSCFISYRHADNLEPGRQWATWLHQSLETYEVPPDLAGRPNSRGQPVPASLYPVFRDEEELSADSHLSAGIRRALEKSRLLVVLCSPRSAQSRYVEEEVRIFKELGRCAAVLALIIDGEPNATDAGSPERECFPHALRYGTLRQDGSVDWSCPVESLAADVRPQGRPGQGCTSGIAYHRRLLAENRYSREEVRQLVDDYEQRLDLAKLKIIAGALGVPLGELTQREKSYQLKKARLRSRRLRQLVALFAVLAAAAVIFGIQALRQRSAAVLARNEAQHARDLAEQGRYAADIRLAAQSVNAGNVGEALGLLENDFDMAVGYRGFEWGLLRGMCDGSSLATYSGHTNEVRSVVFSPDGTTLATGSTDGTLTWLDPSAHRELRKYSHPGLGFMTVAYSPDGKIIAAGTGDWSKSSEPGQIYLFRAAGDEPPTEVGSLGQGHAKAVNSVTFSPDGHLLASCSEDNMTLVWQLDSDMSAPVMRLKGHSVGANQVRFSPDGQFLATAFGDGHVTVWKMGPRDARAPFPVVADRVISPSGVMGLAFAPTKGEMLLATRDGTIVRWNFTTNQMQTNFSPDQGITTCLTFSIDGSMLATGGSDGTIKIWDARSYQFLGLCKGHRDMVFSVAFSAQGLLASGGNDHLVKFWNPTHANDSGLVATLPAAVTAVMYAPEGGYLAGALGISSNPAEKFPKVFLQNLVDHATAMMKNENIADAGDYFLSGACSRDGLIAAGDNDGAIMLWNPATRALRRQWTAHTDAVLGLAFSPDGRLLASGSRDGSMKVWSMDQLSPPRQFVGHHGWVRSVAFSPDNQRLVTASSDRTVRLWDLKTGTELKQWPGFGGACNCAQFSPDGKMIVVGSNDRTIRFFHADGSYDEIMRHAYNAAITCLAFSPDGRNLAAGAQNSEVIIWNITIGQEVTTLKLQKGGILSLQFSPDDRSLAVGTNDGTLQTFNAATWEHPSQLTWSTP